MILLSSSPYWPFAVLLIGIVLVIVMISKWRIHPFLSLMLTAIVVGLISTDLPETNNWSWIVSTIELPMLELGSVAGKIAWVIALAAIIGTAMMMSGAADSIVQWLIKALGEKYVGWALMLSGLILSIPVFFDTVFFLLIPLVVSLGRRTGKNYVFYVMAICAGGVLTHSLVPPTPGPLVMAETLNIDLGATILAGLAASLIPAVVALRFARWADIRVPVDLKAILQKLHGEGEETDDSGSPALPVTLAALPIVVPIVLISLVSIFGVLADSTPDLVQFLGNKNIAMTLGALIAIWFWVKRANLSLEALGQKMNEPLQLAGIIILITSAGGAFGAMIKHAGIGDAIQYASAGFQINYVLLGWILAAIMKIAQGSSTVAMITTASILTAIMGEGSGDGASLILVYLSIGFGAMFGSWMNDSGFWVVGKLSGFTEKETLNTWTRLLAVISLVGLVEVFVVSLFI